MRARKRVIRERSLKIEAIEIVIVLVLVTYCITLFIGSKSNQFKEF
jgi:hypothetical protein